MALLAEILLPENFRIRRSRRHPSTPAGVFTLHVQDKIFHLKGKLMA
jgi:hypothetical protein